MNLTRASAVILTCLASSALAVSRETISAERAGQHVGEEMTVCGLAVDTNYVSGIRGQPTLKSAGAFSDFTGAFRVVCSQDNPEPVCTQRAQALYRIPKIQKLIHAIQYSPDQKPNWPVHQMLQGRSQFR